MMKEEEWGVQEIEKHGNAMQAILFDEYEKL